MAARRILGVAVSFALFLGWGHAAGAHPPRAVHQQTTSPGPGRATPATQRTATNAASALPEVTAGTTDRVPATHEMPRASISGLGRVMDLARFPYRAAVRRAAARHSLDPRLVFAIILAESGGNPAAVSPGGAIGLMQLMPDTARHLGVDPWDPVENIEGAVRYFASLHATFGSVDLSLIAYNAGPGFAMRYLRGDVDLGAETRAFLVKVGEMVK